jgi:hypothetical protein
VAGVALLEWTISTVDPESPKEVNSSIPLSSKAVLGPFLRKWHKHRTKDTPSWIQNLTIMATETAKLFSLEGQTAVVTGGTRGIGQAAAIAIAEAGADVILIQVYLSRIHDSKA